MKPSQPDLEYTLIDPSGSTDPDTGDIDSGSPRADCCDHDSDIIADNVKAITSKTNAALPHRFGRVKDCRWLDTTGPTDVARHKYGYDRASNRLWREDTVAVSQSNDFDELYAYDGLYRLANMQRGRLNTNKDGNNGGTLTFEQCWTLDETGNWSGS